MSETVTIASLAAGGDGVARLSDGRVVFVPRTAVGDVATVDLTTEKKSYARGALRVLESAGPGRTEAPCQWFVSARCGGCQWLHLERDVQLEAKRDLVASALRNVVGAAEIEPVRAASPPLHWRRRARFHWVRPKGSATAVVGFAAPRSNRVTEPLGCVQIDPALAAVLTLISTHLATELHKRGEIDVVLGADDRALVAVRGPHARRALEALAACPEVAGVGGRGAPIGAESLVFDADLPVTATSFAQASSAGNRALKALVGEVLDAEAPLGNALELFAGAGNLTAVLAERAARVVAVERASGPRIERDNVEWLLEDGASALKTVAAARERFDVVVLDPPRSGAADCISGILALAAKVIVYVSCDPATLARDLAALAEAYEVVRVAPLDLMPQTSHVEVVTVLRRR